MVEAKNAVTGFQFVGLQQEEDEDEDEDDERFELIDDANENTTILFQIPCQQLNTTSSSGINSSATTPLSPELTYQSVRSGVSFADQSSSPSDLAELFEIPRGESIDSFLPNTALGDSSESGITPRPAVFARKVAVLRTVDPDIHDCIKTEDKFTRIASEIVETATERDHDSPSSAKFRRALSTQSIMSIRSLKQTHQTPMHKSTSLSSRNSLSSAVVASALNIHVASGYVCDYLERLRTRAESVGSAHMHQIRIMLGPRDAALRSRSAREGLNAFGLVPSLYRECVDFVCQEKAIDAMLGDVTLFWKCQDHPDWRFRGRETLISSIKDMVSFTRQSICLRDEVSNWLMRKKLLADGRKKERIQFDGAIERFDRLQEFWTHVHMDTRKTDNLLRNLPNSRPNTSSTIGERPLSRVGLPSSLPSLSQQSSGLITPGQLSFGSREISASVSLPDLLRSSARETQGLAVPGQRPDSKCWKTRASRSHCTYGLKPVWPQEPTPMHSAATSSRVSTANAQERPGSKGWEHWSEEKEVGSPHKLSSRTSNKACVRKWWAQGENLSRLMKPKHIPISKCTSLPSLRTNSLYPPSPSNVSFCTFSDTASFVQTEEDPCRARSAFVEPWPNEGPSMKCVNPPPKQYLRACQSNKTNPKPLPFVTGHSPKLDRCEEGLLDRDLAALTEVARDVLTEDVELQGNSMLTEKALLPFFSALSGTPLSTLNLRRVVHVGKTMCMEALVMLLEVEESTGSSQLSSLRYLNLSSVPMAFQWHLPLCKAISGHPSLKDVHLADVGLGKTQAKESIDALLSSSTLQLLNIGWNCLSTEVLTHLGACVVANGTLQSLSLANCSSAMAFGGVSPVLFFAECLTRDTQLTHLDLSLNRIDYRGALIIEDALTNHRRLTDLVISNNPLGALGMRSLLRLLAQDQSGLQNFVCDGCSTGTYPPSDDRHPIFTATNPSGRYTLDLEQPYSRALLRMLYRTCDRFELNPDVCFTHVAFKGGSYAAYHHPEKDAKGFRSVPEFGRIVVTFTIERAVDGALRDVREDDFGSFLRLHDSIMRLRPGFKKLVPMFAQWRKLNNLAQEQTVFANALSKDFSLTYSHVRCLCENSAGASANIVWQLLPCIIGSPGQTYLCSQLAPTLGDFVNLMHKARNFLYMNVENPTGHYKLNLENATCYAVAEWLMLLDRWEACIGSKRGRVDTSQNGNRSHVRNATYQDRALTHSMAEWILPSRDELEFDYCSTKRAPLDAAVLDKVTFTNMMVVMQQSEVPGYMMAEALRKISHHMYLKSLQLREILCIFSDRELVGHVCIMFINRIVDMWNEKVFRVRFDDREFLQMCNQVGFCTLFPFVQPEQINLELDLKYYDQRLAANILICLAKKERIDNLIDLDMIGGSNDPLPLAIRISSWEKFDKMPQAGVFKATYRCAPEDHKMGVRQQLFECYGNWKMPSDAQVLWWADVAHVPTDVILLLCFIARRFHCISAAYDFMLGVESIGQITLRNFEDKLRELHFVKFKGTSESDRIKAVYRYLDASHEGLVSRKEFGVLELIWKEVNVCISEFTKFLERTLGNDYDEIWEFFDEDGSGSIDYEEWMDTAKRLGYFGTVAHIFYFMDVDGDGTISMSEFLMLKHILEQTSSYRRVSYSGRLV